MIILWAYMLLVTSFLVSDLRCFPNALTPGQGLRLIGGAARTSMAGCSYLIDTFKRSRILQGLVLYFIFSVVKQSRRSLYLVNGKRNCACRDAVRGGSTPGAWAVQTWPPHLSFVNIQAIYVAPLSIVTRQCTCGRLKKTHQSVTVTQVVISR